VNSALNSSIRSKTPFNYRGRQAFWYAGAWPTSVNLLGWRRDGIRGSPPA
jgi:hypothetical protein